MPCVGGFQQLRLEMNKYQSSPFDSNLIFCVLIAMVDETRVFINSRLELLGNVSIIKIFLDK